MTSSYERVRENYERIVRLGADIEAAMAHEERMKAQAQAKKIAAGRYDGEAPKPLRHADTGEILTWH